MTGNDEIVDLVDENDEVIGRAQMQEVRARNLLRRGAAAIVRNSRGDIYIHRRADTKAAFPGWYDTVVAGSVMSGESYEQAIRRELAEEIGIDGVQPTFLFKSRYRATDVNWWTCVFEVVWNQPIQHHGEEVAWGGFMPEPDLVAKLAEWPFVPGGVQAFQRYLDQRGLIAVRADARLSGPRAPTPEAGLGSEPVERRPRASDGEE